METVKKSDPIYDEERSDNAPKRIGKDFVLVQLENGDWAMKLIVGDKSVFTGASPHEVALWKSRNGMYAIFAKIWAATDDNSQSSIDVRNIIANSRLDMGRIVPKENSNAEQD